ncbi:hypothetical protein [Nocardioides panaciterrulae]|uniref:Uncharacterized protein n=1 Tax=Nocardioides panaciterrulae TaxID=661492 RepID=A0A7Y9E3E2_9ACTN|nr:hypothetical protein [Nocardioides panaciterrulae]NYD40474.1 hypothetical protein [Nocardioides panaciterrulae]
MSGRRTKMRSVQIDRRVRNLEILGLVLVLLVTMVLVWKAMTSV